MLTDDDAGAVGEVAAVGDADQGADGTVDPAVLRAQSLIALSELGADAAPAALDALDAGPDAVAALLHDLAITGDPQRLEPTATLAALSAPADTDFARALIHLAIAAVLADPPDDEEAAELITEVREADPGHEPTWMRVLAEITQHHPRVATLIAQLAAPRGG